DMPDEFENAEITDASETTSVMHEVNYTTDDSDSSQITGSNAIAQQNQVHETISPSTSSHPQIVITPKKLDIQGPRQLILDTE
ncbi:hypothetical protein NL299_27940, partial [Klebsiella pneumoniae]|nr:hypothetical protein [Klebsiella pneumoniae]